MPLATLENFSVATSNSTAVHPDLAWTGDTSRIPVIEPVMTEEQTLAKFQNFMEAMEQVHLRQGGQAPLESLVQVLHRAAQGDNDAIKQAMKKKSGYWSRLFSQESWSEWAQDRTALGQVITILADYMNSPFILKMFLKRLDKELLERANEEARLLLQTLSEKAEPSKKALPQLAFEKISDVFMAIDTAVSLMLPLPPGALAAENNLPQIPPDPATPAWDLARTLNPSDVSKFIEHAVKLAEISSKHFERTQRQQIAQAEHEKDQQEYAAAWEKFERAKRLYPPTNPTSTGGYYLDMGTYREQRPHLIPILAWADKKNGVCEQIQLPLKGFLRWSIYRNEWGRDTLMAGDAYNYDIGQEKPTVAESSPEILPNFCH